MARGGVVAIAITPVDAEFLGFLSAALFASALLLGGGLGEQGRQMQMDSDLLKASARPQLWPGALQARAPQERDVSTTALRDAGRGVRRLRDDGEVGVAGDALAQKQQATSAGGVGDMTSEVFAGGESCGHCHCCETIQL